MSHSTPTPGKLSRLRRHVISAWIPAALLLLGCSESTTPDDGSGPACEWRVVTTWPAVADFLFPSYGMGYAVAYGGIVMIYRGGT
jgi:hypothetical protein